LIVLILQQQKWRVGVRILTFSTSQNKQKQPSRSKRKLLQTVEMINQQPNETIESPTIVKTTSEHAKIVADSPRKNQKEETLGSYDILCGRGKIAFNNIGNRRFRVTISLNLHA
jgi:hypothetical protein